MAKALFSLPRFTNDDAARKHLEALRWPSGPVCPHCGGTERNSRLQGEAHRPGVIFCGDCRTQFTVTVGTVFERSKVPLHKWVLATHLVCSAKKGISAHQLHRTLGVTYKTAWFMAHRIRESMRDGGVRGPMGGEGKIVEADETYYGRAKNKPLLRARTTPYTKKGHFKNNRAIVALVERGGNVRTFHIAHADKVTVTKIVRENIAQESRLHTDESLLYRGSDEHFASHEAVRHSAKEYVRGDVHTNSAEGYFSIFKRGMKGVYSIAARNICIAISRSSISATQTAPQSA